MKTEIILKDAIAGVREFLNDRLKKGAIAKSSYDEALANCENFLMAWLEDPKIDELSPNLKAGIADAISQGKWENIVNAFRKKMSFGTGGIRGLMAAEKSEIEKLNNDGLDAKILKGPNTINNITLLVTSAGVAKYGQNNGLNKIVLGYDSRVRGFDFVKSIAELFLAYDFTVYIFDAPCPYPEVTFAIPYKDIRADMGILISASHNDYRYNGYKLSSANGSQFDPEQRADMYNNYILKANTTDVKQTAITDAELGRVVWLGGDDTIKNFDYMGHERNFVNIHRAHMEHMEDFLLKNDDISHNLEIGFCAYHGAGRLAVPNLLKDIGFEKIYSIHTNGLNDLNGLFPSFNSDPGMEQQPDPGDPRSAKVAVEAFLEEYGQDKWAETDILIGTDPDADRCGVVVKVPENQRSIYGGRDYYLMPADEMWSLLVDFRMRFDKSIEADETFITLSHTTTDCIAKVAESHGAGVIQTWVGFANLSAAVRQTWDATLPTDLVEGKTNPNDEKCNPFITESTGMHAKRRYNLGAMEQSNGYSLLGYPPKDAASLGEKGHVRDKDGTFAGMLMAEIANWAKDNGKNLIGLMDEIYCKPDIGLFINHYEPDPLDGEYPGIQGDAIKKAILRRALALHQFALAGGLEIAGRKVVDATIYRTGKYDHVYPPTPDFQFPDEGVRLYLSDNRLNQITIRPSGTSNSLRFHLQLHEYVNQGNILERKAALKKEVLEISNELRKILQAPRSSELL